MTNENQPDQEHPDLVAARSERERAAAELYGVRRSSAPDRHRELEQEYNRANARVHTLEGRRGAYYCQRDARDDFEFKESESLGNRGQTIRTMRVDGELSDPATVVNWRNTEVGKRHDVQLRRQVSSKTGDDAGHIVACEFGVDPAESRNVSRQSPIQNQGKGSWRAMEQRAREHCSQSPDHRVRFEVHERFHSDRFGNRRPLARDAQLDFGLRRGAHFERTHSERLDHLNARDYKAIEQRTGEKSPRPENPGRVILFPDESDQRRARIRERMQAQERPAAPTKPPTKKR